MDYKRLLDVEKALEEKINNFDVKLLSKFPKEKYLRYLKSYPRRSMYGYVSQEVKSLCKDLINESGEDMLELYHKLILVDLMIHALDDPTFKIFPSDIKRLYEINFERILGNIESEELVGFYKYSYDRFKKDLALCNLKLIPAGAQKVNLARIPVRFLFRGGIKQFLQGLIYIFFELRGTTLFDMHTDIYDPNLLMEFTPEGWKVFYRRLAELLELYPDVKGVFGNAWLLDPKLEEVSPRLAYIRKLLVDIGGVTFYNGITVTGIEDAISKSPTRKRLYEEGKYLPRNYLGILSRNRLIDWAKRTEN